MVATELYFDVEKASIDQPIERTVEEAAELEELQLTRQLADDCGFIRMRETVKDRIQLLTGRDAVLKQLGARHVTAKEHAHWQRWLPTAYTSLNGSWGQYDFDMIPIRVLEIIKTVRGKELFTELVIRTPENTKIDPALFGKAGDTWYLLARWAESDEHLLPIEELPHVTRMLYLVGCTPRNFSEIPLILIACVLGGVLVSALSLVAGLLVGMPERFALIGFGGGFACVALLLTFTVIQAQVRLFRLKKKHPIAARAFMTRMKAITAS